MFSKYDTDLKATGTMLRKNRKKKESFTAKAL